MIDYAQCILKIQPDAQFSIGESWESLVWHNQSIPQPTYENITAIWPLLQKETAIKQANDALKTHIDHIARERDYDSAVSCASYATSTNLQWQAEAQAFITWRDLVYEYALDLYAQVQAEEMEPPTLEDFIANAPSMEWPEHD
jgi:hypothetical protein